MTTWTDRFAIEEPEPQRKLKKGEYDPEVRKRKAQRRARRKYYEKNKEELNRKRRAHLRSPKGQFGSCKQRAKRRDQEWNLTFEEWWDIWCDAPNVFVEEERLHKPAYMARGNNPLKHTQMCRLDTSEPWEVGNVEIRFKNQPIPKSGMVPDWNIDEGRPYTWAEMDQEAQDE